MTTAGALAIVHDTSADAVSVYDAVVELLDLDPVVGVAAVFDLLATEPRIKPSRGLVIDPDDGVRRRWERRVAAAAALLDSPHAARVADELTDELAHDPVFAHDVAAIQRTGNGQALVQSVLPA